MEGSPVKLQERPVMSRHVIEKFYEQDGRAGGWIVIEFDEADYEVNRFGPFRTRREARAQRHDP
jgi:hypothetical protein